MKINNEIFDLIHSMSPAEKGYFKKLSLKHKNDAAYMLLFEEICNLSSYNKKSIEQLFRKHSNNPNINVTCGYLMETVLDALHAFQAEKNIENQLDKKIAHIKILYNKGLLQACEEQMRKAKDMAIRYDLHIHLLQILAFEYSFYQFRLKYPSGFFEQEKATLNTLKRINRNNQWYTNILLWMQKHDRAQTPHDRETIDNLFNSDNGFTDVAEIPFKPLNTIHAAETIYSYAIGENKPAMYAKIKQLNNYLNNTDQRKANYRSFLLVYANTLALIYNNKDVEAFKELYSRLPEMLLPNSSQKILEKEIVFAHGLGLCKLTEDNKGGILFADKINKEIDQYADKFSLVRYTDICFNAAVMCFWEQHYRKALVWLNRILNSGRVESRQYIYCYARIFELILHMEAGNTELLKSRAASTFRYLYMRNKVHDFERVMLGYLKKLIQTTDVAEREKQLKNLKNDLLQLQEDPIKSMAMEHFDYVKWLEEKLKNSSV